MDKKYKALLIIVEALWVMMLVCACVAFIQVITSHAEEPAIIMGGKYVELHHDAIDIDEAPPINRVSDALDEVDANGHRLEYLFEATITYYCPCSRCNGHWGAIDGFGQPLEWGCVAVDPHVIPLRTKLVIDGYDAVFEARDTGSGVDGRHIDVFVPVSHSEALRMGQGEKRKVWRWIE